MRWRQVGSSDRNPASTAAIQVSPSSVSIKKGDKVTWKWTQGGVPHNVTPARGGAGSATSSKKGFTYTKSFPKAGSFSYVCTLHSGMKVTVKVR